MFLLQFLLYKELADPVSPQLCHRLRQAVNTGNPPFVEHPIWERESHLKLPHAFSCNILSVDHAHRFFDSLDQDRVVPLFVADHGDNLQTQQVVRLVFPILRRLVKGSRTGSAHTHTSTHSILSLTHRNITQRDVRVAHSVEPSMVLSGVWEWLA